MDWPNFRQWARIGRRLFVELGPAALVAGCYTAYAAEPDLKSVLSSFGPAFFLAAWAIGQFNRVAKQARTEDSFKGLDARLEAVADRLEIRTARLVEAATGGDAFATIEPFSVGRSLGVIYLHHGGDFPLREVSAHAADLSTFDAKAFDLRTGYIAFDIGTLVPGTAATDLDSTLPITSAGGDFNIFFSALNGLWTQQLRVRYVGTEMKTAWRVTRRDDRLQEVELGRHAQAGFPETEMFSD